MFDLSDRVALVTGGSRGIGRAISSHLAARGASVAINYKEREEAAREALSEIEGRGGRGIIVQGDVAVPEDAERVVKTTIEGLGGLDILVNNAGFNRDTLILRMSVQDWDEVMAVNLRAVFLCTKASLRSMLKQRWGRIINIGSVSGLAGNAGQSNYAAAKSGLIGFTKAVAREMGSRNVTANLIAPGLIRTELTKDVSQEIVDLSMQRILLGRVGKPEDIAAAVVYFASEEASYITGQVLAVDGGLGM
jgi:3-oxoacyl-[acyl-carrier protein] reductase